MEHGYRFYDFESWNVHLQQAGYTFAFGTRFHGNMMALRNGIPALWIVHDMRLQELVSFLKLPHIMPEDFLKADIEDLLAKCDYDLFYKNYCGRLQNYVSFLEENGIEWQ